jgi:hypothetical protein
MSSSEKIDLLRDFMAGVYLSRAQIDPIPTHPPLTHSILIHTGKGGEEGGRIEPERRLEGQKLTKLGRNTNMTDCTSSLWTIINTCRKVPLHDNFFRWHFSLVSTYLISRIVHGFTFPGDSQREGPAAYSSQRIPRSTWLSWPKK